MNSRRLYRCRHDRQLAGVASGIAEYLDLDPTLVRVLWIISVFFGGFTILLYVILAFVMPLEPMGAPLPTGGPTGPVGGDDPAAVATGQGVATDAAGDPAVTTGWIAPTAATGPVHAHRSGGSGRLGIGLGVMLVVFGTIALIGPAFPGWVSAIALWPAFLLALGVGLLVAATRRSTTDA